MQQMFQCLSTVCVDLYVGKIQPAYCDAQLSDILDLRKRNRVREEKVFEPSEACSRKSVCRGKMLENCSFSGKFLLAYSK
jgi:hypothetical protein